MVHVSCRTPQWLPTVQWGQRISLLRQKTRFCEQSTSLGQLVSRTVSRKTSCTTKVASIQTQPAHKATTRLITQSSLLGMESASLLEWTIGS
jgi:hypothetical protein